MRPFHIAAFCIVSTGCVGGTGTAIPPVPTPTTTTGETGALDTGTEGLQTGTDEDEDGYTLEDGDCDDTDAAIHPGAAEVECDNIDNDCNGSIDDGVASWEVIRSELDRDGDRIVDLVREFTYRADGALTVERIDTDGDGVVDITVTDTRDEDGLLSERFTDGPGTADDERVIYTRDTLGRSVLEAIDLGDNGLLDNINDFVYHADTELEERERRDDDADGSWDSITETTYDDADRWLLARSDRDGNGTWDYTREREYDPNGNLLRERTDYDADPQWDYIQTYTLDADGQVVRYEWDATGDGEINQIITYTRDEEGRVVAGQADDNGDGAIDRRWEEIWGKRTHIVRQDDTDDGAWNRIEESIFDEEGRTLLERFDFDGDGAWDLVFEQRFENDKRVYYGTDSDGDGAPEYVWTGTFDAYGNQLTSRTDLDGDGSIDQETVFWWECVGT